MTRTQKIIVGVLVMAIIIAMAFAVAISAPQGVAYADPLPSLQNVAVDGDGVLRWDAFSGAAEYNVLFGSGGGYARDGEGNSVTYYDLETIAKQFHWESGTYNWSVCAVDEGDNDLTVTAYGTYTFNNTQTALSAPTNLVWDHTILRWDAVEGAGFYYVSVYKNGAFINGMSGDAYDNYKDFGTSFEVDKTYRCEVEARASYNDLEHKTSVATVSPDKTFSSVVPSLTNVTVTNGKLTFDAVAGAYQYDIGVYNGGGVRYALPIDLYAMCAGFGLEDGTYDVSINVFNEYNEPLVPEYTYNGFEWDDAYGPQPMTGTVTINGTAKIGETLTVNTSALGYTGDLTYTWWMENGFGFWIPYEMDLAVNTYVIPTDDLAGRRLYVRVESSGNTGYIESDPTDYIVKMDAPDAPDVGKTDCTTNANNNGTITGVDDTMEYKLSSADDWTDCSGTSVTGLINGTYYVRIKETTTRDASAQATVVIESSGLNFDVISVGGNPVSAELGEGEFVNGAFPLGHVGEAYSATLVAEGGSGEYTWAVIVGSLAAGLTLNADTGVVSGTPTETTRGSITVRVTDKADGSLTDNVQLTFNVMADDWVPNITTTTADNAAAGEAYYMEFGCDSGVADEITWTFVSGSLPTGLALGKSGMFLGTLSGTPTAVGTYTFTLKAENGFGSDTQEYTIVVENLMTLTYPAGKYYLGDTVQVTSSIGNNNVIWGMATATGSSTVSATGLLTIANDEPGTYVTVFARSKTNSNNAESIMVEFTNGTAHTITVIGGSSTDSSSNPISKAAEGESVYINAPELAGKQFRIWTVEEGSAGVTLFNENASSSSFDMPAGNVILKANYDTVIDTVSATFDTPVNGQHVDQTLTTGGVGYTATISGLWEGSSFRSIDDTVYETGKEYTFFVQFAANAGYVLVDKSELSVTINGTQLTYPDNYNLIYSSWIIPLTAVTDEVPHYAVTVENGIADKSLAEASETITITANAPAAGYVFDRWTTASGVTFASATSAETTFVMPASAVTVTATYKLIPQYTVSFDANGGTGSMVEQVVNEGTLFELPASLFIAPANKVFKCWSVGGVEKNVGDEITVNANVSVQAVWAFITHTISFNANGGSGTMANQQANQGSTYSLPACTFTAPEGKEFKCWSVGENNMNVGDNLVVNGNVEVKAVWEYSAPTIFFNANGGTGEKAAENVNHGAIFILPANPFTAPEGKEFDGWAYSANGAKIEGNSIQVNNDVTLYARWKDVGVAPVDSEPSNPAQPSQPVTPTEPSQPTVEPEEEPEAEGGLSGGAIAGIVVGSVAFAGIAGFAIFWFVIKKKKIADIIALFSKKK